MSNTLEFDSESVSKAPEAFPRDQYTLRVRGGDQADNDPRKRPTDPVGLSRSILHVLYQNKDGYVNIQSVGPVALNVVMTAFRIASEEAEKRTKGSVLVCRQSEYTAEIGGRRRKGICTRIFGIPIKDAL